MGVRKGEAKQRPVERRLMPSMLCPLSKYLSQNKVLHEVRCTIIHKHLFKKCPLQHLSIYIEAKEYDKDMAKWRHISKVCILYIRFRSLRVFSVAIIVIFVEEAKAEQHALPWLPSQPGSKQDAFAHTYAQASCGVIFYQGCHNIAGFAQSTFVRLKTQYSTCK